MVLEDSYVRTAEASLEFQRKWITVTFLTVTFDQSALDAVILSLGKVELDGLVKCVVDISMNLWRNSNANS